MVGDAVVGTIQQIKMYSLFLKNIGDLTKYDRSLKAPARQGAACQSLITPMTADVMRHMNKI